MHVVLWISRIFIFLFLLVFAMSNKELVNVKFFLGAAWQAPLIIVILVSFAAGAVLGLLALLGTVFNQRRELSKLKKEMKLVKEQLPASPSEPA